MQGRHRGAGLEGPAPRGNVEMKETQWDSSQLASFT